MRLAVFSDIHGNCFALDALLADLQTRAIDQLVCLGDAIQGGAQPAETAARLRSLQCPIVMGNADAWLLSGQETGGEATSKQQAAVRSWSLAQLSEEDRTFIQNFRPTVELELSGAKMLFFHGSPSSFDDILLPDTSEEEFQRLLGSQRVALLAGGHTHTQQIRRINDAWFINPGSVGLAYNLMANRLRLEAQFQTDAWAEYAIVTAEEHDLRVEFMRVPYDLEQFLAVLAASGRPFADEFAASYRRKGHVANP